MPHQFKIRVARQMGYVPFLSGKKIIKAENVIPLLYQTVAKVAA
jgi:hypothetical protein